MGQLGKCLNLHVYFVTAHLLDGFTVSAELCAAFCKLLKTFSRSLIVVFGFSLCEDVEGVRGPGGGESSVSKSGRPLQLLGELAQCCLLP